MTLRSAAVIGALVAAGILGAYVGRHTAPVPAPLVQVQERTVYQDRVVTVREAARVEQRVVYRDRVETPDGTVTVREVERADMRTEQREQVAQVTERAVDVQRVEMPAPVRRRRVSLLVGVPLRLTPAPVVLVGGHIQRRLFGPISAGAWTLIPTGPGAPVTAGVSVSLEW